jgi:hypothetical protein
MMNIKFNMYNSVCFTYKNHTVGYIFDKETMLSLTPYINRYEVYTVDNTEYTIYNVCIENCVLSQCILNNLTHYYYKTNTTNDINDIYNRLLKYVSTLQYDIFTTTENTKTYFNLSINNELFTLNENGFIYGGINEPKLPSLADLINFKLFNYNNPNNLKLKAMRYSKIGFSPIVKNQIFKAIDGEDYLIINSSDVDNIDELNNDVNTDYILFIALLKKEKLMLNKIRKFLYV